MAAADALGISAAIKLAAQISSQNEFNDKLAARVASASLTEQDSATDDSDNGDPE